MGLDVTSWRYVDIDKYAVKSFNAIFGTDYVPTDITKLKGVDLGIRDTDQFMYIMTYSFPCQDISNAGKQAGYTKGSGTRSGLLWEVERLLEECLALGELPNVVLMENVPQVHSTKNAENFNKWQEKLRWLGYQNHWQDLNAKDFGIPQNRLRTFMVSFLPSAGDDYHFPKPVELKLRLKDMLEDSVDEKFYLSDEIVEKMLKQMKEESNPTTPLPI